MGGRERGCEEVGGVIKEEGRWEGGILTTQ